MSLKECEYEDGSDPQLLDIIRISFVRHIATPHQRENHLFDSEYYWQKIDQFPFSKISTITDSPATLWRNGDQSYSGLNNRITPEFATGRSLYLVDVGAVVFDVEHAYNGIDLKVHTEFSYQGTNYRLDCTDPIVSEQYMQRGLGSYKLNRAVLCISLGETFQGYCYKLVAGVLYQGRFK